MIVWGVLAGITAFSHSKSTRKERNNKKTKILQGNDHKPENAEKRPETIFSFGFPWCFLYNKDVKLTVGPLKWICGWIIWFWYMHGLLLVELSLEGTHISSLVFLERLGISARLRIGDKSDLVSLVAFCSVCCDNDNWIANCKSLSSVSLTTRSMSSSLEHRSMTSMKKMDCEGWLCFFCLFGCLAAFGKVRDVAQAKRIQCSASSGYSSVIHFSGLCAD